jgi:hypothetical protein
MQHGIPSPLKLSSSRICFLIKAAKMKRLAGARLLRHATVREITE